MMNDAIASIVKYFTIILLNLGSLLNTKYKQTLR